MKKLILCKLLLLALVSCTENELTDYNQIEEDKESTELTSSANKGAYYTGNREITSKHNGVTFTDATFADGATIFNARDITFRNCTFTNKRGYGVNFRKLQDTDDTRNIKFINCKFTGSLWDNVLISRDDNIPDRVLHKDIVFKSCSFRGWANNGTSPQNIRNRGLYHAIYAKCPNVIIDDCRFVSTIDGAGHAVSIRSSARVNNNVFQQQIKGHNPISYSPKNLTGNPDRGFNSLLIENNLMYTKHQNVRVGMIHLETQLNEAINPKNIIREIIIRSNTIVILPGGEAETTYVSCLRVNNAVSSSNIFVYNNLFIDARRNTNPESVVQFFRNIDYYGVNIRDNRPDLYFRDWRNRNYRLKAGSLAIDRGGKEPRYLTPKDLEFKNRIPGKEDVGCYEF